MSSLHPFKPARVGSIPRIRGSVKNKRKVIITNGGVILNKGF